MSRFIFWKIGSETIGPDEEKEKGKRKKGRTRDY